MNSSITRSSRWLATSMLAALLVLTGSAQAPANTQLPAGSVVPSDRHRSVARRVGSMLEGMHYSGNKLDDRLSAIVYARYLESIDGQHTSLLASDVADLEQYKLRFDDMISSGDVDPAFAIFARFQQRNRERVKFALSQLDKEPDWTLNESFEFDREKAPWATTQAELDEWWRKRVKNDALSLLLTGKSWDESSKLLKKRYETTLKRVDQVSADDVFESLMNY
jgi:carboxyl-terminal processing protease